MESDWRYNVALFGVSPGLTPASGIIWQSQFLAKLNPPLPIGIGVWTYLLTVFSGTGRKWFACSEPVPGYVEPAIELTGFGDPSFPGPFGVDPD